MYIYHNKEIDEYDPYTNLKVLCDDKKLNYNRFSNVFSRQKKDRYNGVGFVIVKRKMIKK